MFFFSRSKRAKHEESKETQINDIRKETFKQIDKRIDRLEETNKKMSELLGEDSGVTGKIFLATGGGKRLLKDKK